MGTPQPSGAHPQSRKDIPYLHVLRALATYLVIALHCIAPYMDSAALYGTRTWWACLVVNTLTRMGVPLFFMISGYLLLTDEGTADMGQFYRKRLRRILVPFLFWDVTYFLLHALLDPTRLNLRTFLSELLVSGSEYHLWFVYQIAAIYLLVPFLKKIVDQCTQGQVWLLFFITILPTSLFRLFNVLQSYVYIAPFGSLIEGYVGFFLLGYLLGTSSFSKRARRGIWLLGLAAWIFAVWGNDHYSSPENIHLVFNEGYAVIHFLTSGALFLLLREYGERLPGWVRSLTAKLSRLSYGTYLVHILTLYLFGFLTARLGLDLPPSRYIVCSFLFVSVVSTAAAALFFKVPGLRRLAM